MRKNLFYSELFKKILRMKKILFIFFIAFSTFSFGKEMKLEGIFRGENVVILNPFAASGVGFCVYEVTVNGQLSTDEINSSSFEVDLSVFKLKKGDKISIIIKHKDGCSPKIVNPEVLKPQSTFNITSLKVEKEGTIRWTTTDENGSLPFIVEQYKWKKWVKVGTFDGIGTPSEHHYAVNIPIHSGKNRFRIKQIDYSNKPRYSAEVEFNSLAASVTFEPEKGKKVGDDIIFSAETQYEIFDFYGKLILKGKGKKVDVSKLLKGQYFLNFDNATETFNKK